MAEQSPDAIEELEGILRSLRITEDNVSNKSIEPATPEIKEMSTVPAPAGYNENILITMPKSMVSGPGWFDGDRMKFED